MPKKLTASEKNLTGNRGKRKYSQEFELEYHEPRCPKILSKGAKKYWKKLAPALITMRRLADIHSPGFAHYCEVLSKIDDIIVGLNNANQSLLQEDIMLDKHQQERYQLMESSYSKMFRLYSVIALKMSKEYNLTPAEMKGVYKFADEPDEDDL